MKISTDVATNTPVETSAPTANQAKSEKVSTQSTMASMVEKSSVGAGNAVATPTQRSTDVTFRRDGNGRIYYVVSDAKSGEEILEVPPKTIRDMSQSIDEYLQQREAKSGAHVTVKA